MTKNKKVSNWYVTDPSCNQRFRTWTYEDGHKEFQYRQDCEELGKTAEATINLADYAEENLDNYVIPFGYDNVEEVKKIYGKEWEHIVAECIFETDIFDFLD